MDRSALAALVFLIFLIAGSGCRMCSDCNDYLPPVANGQYAVWGQRAGSAFGPGGTNSAIFAEEVPDPSESVAIQPLPPVEPES